MKKRIIKLLVRIVGHRCITFDGSRVYYWKVPMIVLPMSILSKLQHDLSTKLGPDVNKYLFNLGKIQGENGTNILIKKYNFKANSEDLRFFLEQTKFVGIGVLEDIDKDISKYYLRLRNTTSPFAIAYKEIYGLQKESVCNYMRGLIAGASQAVCANVNNEEREMTAIETKCIAKGDPYCEFEIREKNKFDKKLFGKADFDALPKELIFAKKKETLAALLRTAVSNCKNPETLLLQYLKKNKKNFIDFSDNGEVSIFNAKGLITPMDIINLFFNILEKKYGYKRVYDIVYSIGVEFGLNKSIDMFKRYHFQKDLPMFKTSIGEVGLYGLGHPEIISFDKVKNTLLIKVCNTPGLLFRDLTGLRKEFFDYLLSGFLAGACQFFFDKPMKSTEIKCSVKGHEACVFEITKK